MFDEPRIGATRFFSQDVRQGKRSFFASEPPENQRLLIAVMENEWKKWAKEPDFKARLVVQGCQEDPSMMRTDSPTGSRRNRTVALAHDAKTTNTTRM